MNHNPDDQKPIDGQMSFDDALFNPDYEPPREEKKQRKRKTKEALEAAFEKIIDVEYSDVMRKSYIDYSMSVITSRALPDARDGLKPVQRRILYDMHELGVTHDRPYRKVARIVGDTMGKYHPHGDASIADALVVMAQDFKKMAPMIDGHGNFGSIEGDAPAAQRYIECRMTPFSQEVFLSDIRENTVDFIPNYDENEKEPSVLPARLPNLLINGAEGIAVGMATSIPTHNTGEVIEAALQFLENEQISTKELLAFLLGPDFPTGGIIANQAEILSIYETGQGRLRVRGKVEVEREKGKDRIVISEIPYTMIGDGIGRFLQQVADLVENKTLPEITDISNQSSKEGIRIVLELKKDANTDNIINILYKKTKLEDTFGVNMLAISGGRPETMPLRAILRDFASFQYELSTRRYESLLGKAMKRREIDEGLIGAIDAIDAVVEAIRGSKTVAQAKECLLNGTVEGVQFKTEASRRIAAGFRFTPLQAESILELRLQRLVGLELEVIQEDLKKVLKNIRHYEKLLGSKAEMRRDIQAGLRALKERFAAPRRTELMDAGEIIIEEKPEEVLPVVVLIDRFHYIRCVDPSVYERNKDALDAEGKYLFHTATDQKLLIFTDKGKCHTVKVKDIPLTKAKDKGTPIDNLSGYHSKEEIVVAIEPLGFERELIFVSSDGYIKRVGIHEFDVTRRTIDSTKLMDSAVVVAVLPYTGEGIALYTQKGYHIRFKQEEIPAQGKVARGARGIKLEGGDKVIKVDDGERLRFTKRGGKGKK